MERKLPIQPSAEEKAEKAALEAKKKQDNIRAAMQLEDVARWVFQVAADKPLPEDVVSVVYETHLGLTDAPIELHTNFFEDSMYALLELEHVTPQAAADKIMDIGIIALYEAEFAAKAE